MDLHGKYRSLKTRIQNPTSESSTCCEQDASYFYFKSLAELSLDILLEENEINELRNQIEFMKGKLGPMSAKYAVKKKKEEQKRIIHCEQEECKLTFVKDKELHYHKLFEHQQERLMSDRVFDFRVEEEGKE